MQQKELEDELSILTLQITKENFDLILSGKQKVETRLVFPKGAKRYFAEQPTVANYKNLPMYQYDAIKLINGRSKDAPTLIVMVTGQHYLSITDENDKTIILEESGINYPSLEVYYDLGVVIFKKNIRE